MSAPINPGYEVGRMLGEVQIAFARVAQAFTQGLSDALRDANAPRVADPLEAREIARERAYARRIEAERTAALRFERRYAEKAWQELGLPGRLR